MTGITPEVAAVRSVREEFDDVTRNMNPELTARIRMGSVSDTDRESNLVQKALQVWKNYELLIYDGSTDMVNRMT